MAHALQIDTLAFSKKLRDAGADEALAEAIVEGITGADTSELATKGDLAELRAATKADIAEVKGEIAGLRTATQADIAEVRSEIKGVESRLETKIAELKAEVLSRLWVMGIGIVGLTVTLIKLLP